MGLRDKLTDLREPGPAGGGRSTRTRSKAPWRQPARPSTRARGKYTDKILKYGQKATNAVEKFGNQASPERSAGDAPSELGLRVQRSRIKGPRTPEVSTAERVVGLPPPASTSHIPLSQLPRR